MLTRIGGRWRTFREWATLGEWMPRILRLPPPPQEGFRPGLFLVELSGCDLTAWEWARARDALPFLESLTTRQNYRSVDYHAGNPWCRIARETELLYGVASGLPGEVYLPLGAEAPVDLSRRPDALAAEEHLHRQREGLLREGAAWGTFLPGGAPPHEFHGPLGDRAEGWVEWLRNRYGAALDLRRGVPVVHLRHDCTPPLDVAGAELVKWWRRQDRTMARLYHRARLSRRRDYEVWFLLTPAPPRERAFPEDYGQRLQAALGADWDVLPAGGPRRREAPAGRELRLLARDDIAHLYAAGSVTDAEKMKVARLVLQAGADVGAVLWREADGTPRWQREGAVSDTETLHPPPGISLEAWLPYLVERDGDALLDHPDAGTWIALRGQTDSWHRAGVALLPRRARIGAGRGDWLRAGQIYGAARHALGRERLRHDVPTPVLNPDTFRLATYNAHRCIGMDGRQSVRRVLRVLAEIDADIIAIQEVSAVGFNQADQIAAELGMHSVFCPTLHGPDAYGHGLLSRYPFTVNAVGLLPLVREAAYKEPRGAIWVEIQMGLRSLNIVSTHLALGRADRTAQIDALLGPNWIGGLPPDTPMILCGDFNFTPPGRNYRRLAARFRDVQLAHSRGPVLKTFSTVCAVARLDHMFLSPHFTVLGVDSPRTHLTSVASDHFPLVADLRWPRDSGI
jgi:endonuclease/exonuclease/phosphatase family metal-dependent hydrolase